MKYLSPFILQTIVWIPTRLVLWFFVRFKIIGKENINNLKQNAIVATNHQSELDPILVPASLNPFSKVMPMFYMSRDRDFYEKTGVMKYFYGGAWFKFWGAYPVFVGRKNYDAALKYHLEILRNGKTLLVFPEGVKTKDGKVNSGKGGVAYLAQKTNTQIIPLAMSGHFNMTWKDFLLFRNTITLNYGKPLNWKDLFPDSNNIIVSESHDDYITAGNKVMEEVRKLHEEIIY